MVQSHMQGQRAQRIEMLLLHEFYGRKFLLPDKLSQRDRDRIAASQPQPPDDGDTQPGLCSAYPRTLGVG